MDNLTRQEMEILLRRELEMPRFKFRRCDGPDCPMYHSDLASNHGKYAYRVQGNPEEDIFWIERYLLIDGGGYEPESESVAAFPADLDGLQQCALMIRELLAGTFKVPVQVSPFWRLIEDPDLFAVEDQPEIDYTL